MRRLTLLISFATSASYAFVAFLVWYLYDQTLFHNHYMVISLLTLIPLILPSYKVHDVLVTLYLSGLLANLLLLVSEKISLVVTTDTFLIFISFFGISTLLYIVNWCISTIYPSKTLENRRQQESHTLNSLP